MPFTRWRCRKGRPIMAVQAIARTTGPATTRRSFWTPDGHNIEAVWYDHSKVD